MIPLAALLIYAVFIGSILLVAITAVSMQVLGAVCTWLVYRIIAGVQAQATAAQPKAQ